MNIGSTNPNMSNTASSYDSSFSQILNRTQQNLNRINQRYATAPGPAKPGMAPITLGNNPPLLANPSFPRLGTNLGGAGFNGLNQNINPNYFQDQQQQMALTTVSPPMPPSQQQQYSQHHQPPANNNNNNNNTNTNKVAIDEQTLNSILSRLQVLEQQQEQNSSCQKDQRQYEKAIDRVEKSLDTMLLEMKDIQRQFTQLHSRMNNNQTVIDNIAMEYEKITQQSVKQINWMKDTEAWRESLNDLLNKINREQYKNETFWKEYESNAGNYINKYEFQLFQEKIQLSVQQNVTSTYTILHEKLTEQLKQVEKEMTLLKLGQSFAVQKEMQELQDYIQHKQMGEEVEGEEKRDKYAQYEKGLTPDLVSRVLGQPMPSELMIKGLVSGEIFQLQNSLQEKIENNCWNFIRQEYQDTKTTLSQQINEQILAICTDSLLYYNPTTGNATTTGPSGSATLSSMSSHAAGNKGDIDFVRIEFERRVAAGKNKLETLEKTLLDRIQYLSKEFLSFSDVTKHSVQDHTIQLEKLKDHLEILQETSNRNATSFVTKLDDERSARKDKEESLLKLIDSNKQELTEKLYDTSSSWLNERLTFEKRFLSLEHFHQTHLETYQYFTKKLDELVGNHPKLLQFATATEMMSNVVQELAYTKTQVSELQNQLYKLQLGTVPLKEYITLQEKVNGLDLQLTETLLPLATIKVQKHEEMIISISTQVSTLTPIVHSLHSEKYNTMKTKIESYEMMLIQLQGTNSITSEELKIVKNRLSTVEQGNVKELGKIEDLTGALSSRVQSCENKVLSLSRSSTQDVSHLQSQLKFLEEKVTYYDQHTTSLLQQVTSSLTSGYLMSTSVNTPSVTNTIPAPVKSDSTVTATTAATPWNLKASSTVASTTIPASTTATPNAPQPMPTSTSVPSTPAIAAPAATALPTATTAKTIPSDDHSIGMVGAFSDTESQSEDELKTPKGFINPFAKWSATQATTTTSTAATQEVNTNPVVPVTATSGLNTTTSNNNTSSSWMKSVSLLPDTSIGNDNSNTSNDTSTMKPSTTTTSKPIIDLSTNKTIFDADDSMELSNEFTPPKATVLKAAAPAPVVQSRKEIDEVSLLEESMGSLLSIPSLPASPAPVKATAALRGPMMSTAGRSTSIRSVMEEEEVEDVLTYPVATKPSAVTAFEDSVDQDEDRDSEEENDDDEEEANEHIITFPGNKQVIHSLDTHTKPVVTGQQAAVRMEENWDDEEEEEDEDENAGKYLEVSEDVDRYMSNVLPMTRTANTVSNKAPVSRATNDHKAAEEEDDDDNGGIQTMQSEDEDSEDSQSDQEEEAKQQQNHPRDDHNEDSDDDDSDDSLSPMNSPVKGAGRPVVQQQTYPVTASSTRNQDKEESDEEAEEEEEDSPPKPSRPSTSTVYTSHPAAQPFNPTSSRAENSFEDDNSWDESSTQTSLTAASYLDSSYLGGATGNTNKTATAQPAPIITATAPTTRVGGMHSGAGSSAKSGQQPQPPIRHLPELEKEFEDDDDEAYYATTQRRGPTPTTATTATTTPAVSAPTLPVVSTHNSSFITTQSFEEDEESEEDEFSPPSSRSSRPAHPVTNTNIVPTAAVTTAAAAKPVIPPLATSTVHKYENSFDDDEDEFSSDQIDLPPFTGNTKPVAAMASKPSVSTIRENNPVPNKDAVVNSSMNSFDDSSVMNTTMNVNQPMNDTTIDATSHHTSSSNSSSLLSIPMLGGGDEEEDSPVKKQPVVSTAKVISFKKEEEPEGGVDDVLNFSTMSTTSTVTEPTSAAAAATPAATATANNSNTSGLTMRERLRLRQEQLKQNRK